MRRATILLATALLLVCAGCGKEDESPEGECLKQGFPDSCKKACQKNVSVENKSCVKLIKVDLLGWKNLTKGHLCYAPRPNGAACVSVCEKYKEPKACKESEKYLKTADMTETEFSAKKAGPRQSQVSCEVDLRSKNGVMPTSRMNAIFLAPDGKLVMQVKSATGVELKVGEAVSTLKLEAEGRIWKTAEIAVALDPFLLEAKTDQLGDPKAKPVKVPITLKTSLSLAKGTLSCNAQLADAVLLGVEKGALVLKGDQGKKGGRASLLIVTPGSVIHHGDSVPMRDVDLVAIVKYDERKLGKCTYKSSKGHDTNTKWAYDAHVTVYDRRTGEKLGSRIWRAKAPTCPRTYTGKVLDVVERASHDAATAWAKGFVKK